MNNLILSVSLALIVGKSHCQGDGNSPPAGQSIPPGNPLGLPAASGNALTNSSYVGELNSLNGTASFNTSLTSNAANATGTSLMGNSSAALYSNTTTSGVFMMNQDMHWSSVNFNIYDQSGNVTYQIIGHQEGLNLTQNEFVVQDATSGEKKLKINARVKACGFGQTYEADDGTSFRLDPRAFLPDRWYISNSSSGTTYVYKRAALSVEGKIYENERVVAQVSTKTNSSTAAVSTRQMTLHSDGTIHPWDLIALLALVKTRIHACGY